MNALLGSFGVVVAAAGSVLLIIAGFAPLAGRRLHPWMRLGARLLLWGAVVAMVALELGLLTNDFSIAYLANHHASTTPLIFTIASAWGALEGSIVLWGLVLAVFTYLVSRRADDELGEMAMGYLGVISLFFFGMMLTVSNPFEVCVLASPAGIGCLESSPVPWAAINAPAEGLGPNPLLQNHILMAVHPPMLYVGYVGLSVPYAFAMAALTLRAGGDDWARRTRKWTMIAWGFLTVGIVLGGWWSYEVLGWGGYWAWDPVENASFLPWLAATAFIHSSLVHQRRGMLQSWNFVLVISTFALTILGTFLTRSGAVLSVHSFTQSAVGPVLLVFLALVTIGSFALFASRAEDVAQSSRLESLVSREGGFLLNNLLLTVFGFVVLVGTIYPIIVEAFTEERLLIGRPFYDRFAIPLSFGLLLFMGLGPVAPWRVARPAILWERTKRPLQWALAVTAIAVVAGLRNNGAILAVLLGSFLGLTSMHQLVVQAGKRSESFPAAVAALFRNDPGYWGGMVAHFGVAVLAVGIAMGAGLSTSIDINLDRGESATIASYDLTYQGGFARTEPQRTVTGARIEVSRNGSALAVLEPRINTYATQQIGTPSTRTTLTGDLYLSLLAISGSGARLEAFYFPLQWMVWLGGLLTALGGLWSSVARRRTGAEARVHA